MGDGSWEPAEDDCELNDGWRWSWRSSDLSSMRRDLPSVSPSPSPILSSGFQQHATVQASNKLRTNCDNTDRAANHQQQQQQQQQVIQQMDVERVSQTPPQADGGNPLLDLAMAMTDGMQEKQPKRYVALS